MSWDLFSYNSKEILSKNSPLADRLRPNSLNEFFGQENIVSKGGFLWRAITSDRIPSMIFYGPPGTGKTTLARIIANTTKMRFEELSAVTSGVSDVKKVAKEAEDKLHIDEVRTILFIDEIHRFNKSQQDALLPFVEKGILTLIGATTENPFFEVNKALLSRMTIIQLESLSREALGDIIERAISDKESGLGNYKIILEEDANEYLTKNSQGDARTALNALEIAVMSEDKNEDGNIVISLEAIKNSIQVKKLSYDSKGDEHYDTASAFIKSMRGSDPDATIYWLAKMIHAGEDPLFIARRIMISAAEDIGLADPNALTVAVSAFQAVHAIGYPEARIPLAEAAVYMATAPKSNSAYVAIDEALSDLKKEDVKKVPKHLRDGSYIGAKDLGNAQGYKYPHSYKNGYVEQEYFPNAEKRKYYTPTKRGYEAKVAKYLKEIIDNEE